MLARGARLHHDERGGLLIGGVPLRVLRLPSATARVVDAWRESTVLHRESECALARRLHRTGLVHLQESAAHTSADVTVVVPVRDDPEGLADCLATLSAEHVVVVDDGSRDPAAVRALADEHGADVLRRDSSGGPAAARNDGLRLVRTPLVAFVDADITLPPGWLTGLLAALTDDVAVVAPRVVGAGGPGVLARYEQGAGPLDLGRHPGPVEPGARVGHVPAAVLLARVADLGAGFDETLRVGEDVDLVWRLADAGRQVRYAPDVLVRHRARAGLLAWCRQRHAYGRSAALLQVRHPGRLAPVVIGTRALPGLLGALTRHPAGLVAGWAAGALWMFRTLPDCPGRGVESARLGGEVPVRSAVLLADGAARTWLPLLLPMATVSRRARRATVLAMGIRLARTRPLSPDPLRAAGLRVLEDLAYASGVWCGALADRRPGAVLPRLRRAVATVR